jgi:hypothetical protein
MKRLLMALILGLVALSGVATASADPTATGIDSVQAP